MGGKRIVRIEITDFESHAHTVIEPAPGLTGITGPTDVGKSGILRALKWVYRNEPAGGGFVRGGASKASVSVTLEDGTEVTRERSASGSVNRYVLTEPGKEPQVLEGFGREVPEVITEALGMRTVELGGEEVALTYQTQHDALFLIRPGLSGVVRAQAIGRLTGVHLLHEASAEVATDITIAKRTLKDAQQEHLRLTQQMEQYADLDRLRAIASQLDTLTDRVRALDSRIVALQDIKARWTAHLQAKARVTGILARLSDLPQCAAAKQQAADTENQAAALRALKERWQATTASLESVNAILSATDILDQAEEWQARASQAEEQSERLQAIAQRWRETITALEEARAIIRAGTAGTEAAAAALATVRELGNTLDRLGRVADDWNRYLIQRVTVDNTLISVRDVEEAAEELAKARTASERLAELQRLRSRFRDWKERARAVRRQYDEALRAEQRAKANYRNAVLAAGKCPTCGQPVDRAKLEEHLASLG